MERCQESESPRGTRFCGSIDIIVFSCFLEAACFYLFLQRFLIEEKKEGYKVMLSRSHSMKDKAVFDFYSQYILMCA